MSETPKGQTSETVERAVGVRARVSRTCAELRDVGKIIWYVNRAMWTFPDTDAARGWIEQIDALKASWPADSLPARFAEHDFERIREALARCG